MKLRGLIFVFVLGLFVSAVADEVNAFRVTPYVQHPATNAMTLLWLAQTNGNATVSWWKQGSAEIHTIDTAHEIAPTDRIGGSRFTALDTLQYCSAPELSYTNSVEAADNYPAYTREGKGAGWTLAYTVPWQYRVRLTGLEPDTTYGYRVTLVGGASYEKTFRTAPTTWRTIKFTLFSDSETEPADNPYPSGCTTDWADPATGKGRRYYATQTAAYATNLIEVTAFQPDLIVMAGDLAQKGSRQVDWDEFWRHNAGPLNDPAGSIPIVASPGNHDYWSYDDHGTAGMKKYLSYFEYEPNGAAVDDDQQERFHRVDYGPVAFIFLDANNGPDDDLEKDTNKNITQAGGCRAPDFNPGSAQYAWLETQLADAQRNRAFTFVVSHQCPYSAGYHGMPITQNNWSGRALRILNDLMLRYGVDGWLCGHDEMAERSTVTGTETLPDGTERAHTMHVYDMGIAGDGLRGVQQIENPNEQFRAYKDSAEVYDAQGVLTEGGVHYGHLQVSVDPVGDGTWKATLDPVYCCFTTNATGAAVYLGLKHYADKIELVSDAFPEPTPEPTPVETGIRRVVATAAEKKGRWANAVVAGDNAYGVIQSQIDASADGETVLLKPGTYVLTNQLSLIKNRHDGVTVKSDDGTYGLARKTTFLYRPATTTNRLVYISAPRATVEGLTLTNGFVNAAHGGGAYLDKCGADAGLRSCDVLGCTAYYAAYLTGQTSGNYACGGGAYISGSGCISNCYFRRNIAFTAGGVAMSSSKTAFPLPSEVPRVTASEFYDNEMIGYGDYNNYGNGSAVFSTKAAYLDHCSLVSNVCNTTGGRTRYKLIGNVGGYLVISNCYFEGNQRGKGGSWSLIGTNSDSGKHFAFVGNTMYREGQANLRSLGIFDGNTVIECANSIASFSPIRNSLFIGNKSYCLGGNSAKITAENCTFINNVGAIYSSGGGPSQINQRTNRVVNCVFYGNQNDIYAINSGNSKPIALFASNCCIRTSSLVQSGNHDFGSVFTSGCVTFNGSKLDEANSKIIRFRDISHDDLTLNDYRLQVRSKIRDAGLKLAWMDGAIDLDARPRCLSRGGNPTASACPDIGAYECELPRPGIALVVK